MGRLTKKNFIPILPIVFALFCVSVSFTVPKSNEAMMLIAGSTAGGGGESPNQEIGYTTIGSTSGGYDSGRRIEIVVPSGGMTVSYGYLYASNASDGNDDFTMAVYQTGGTQVGACSNSTTITAESGAWYEVTWSSPPFLSEGTYYVQFHNEGVGNITRYTDATGSNNAYGTDACGTMFTSSSSQRATMSVANYDAR